MKGLGGRWWRGCAQPMAESLDGGRVYTGRPLDSYRPSIAANPHGLGGACCKSMLLKLSCMYRIN